MTIGNLPWPQAADSVFLMKLCVGWEMIYQRECSSWRILGPDYLLVLYPFSLGQPEARAHATTKKSLLNLREREEPPTLPASQLHRYMQVLKSTWRHKDVEYPSQITRVGFQIVRRLCISELCWAGVTLGHLRWRWLTTQHRSMP